MLFNCSSIWQLILPTTEKMLVYLIVSNEYFENSKN